MKKILTILASCAMMAMAVSCGEENTTPTPAPTPGGNTGNNGDGGNGGQQTEALKADFTFVADGMTVTFTNASTGATAYMWDFGDEVTSTEQNPTHEYAAAGEYTVTLTVSDAAGATAKKEATLNVAGAVKAYFSAASPSGREGKFGRIVTLDATSSENIVSVAWDFGDGETVAAGTEFVVTHEYAEEGTYKVKISVVGLAGDTDEYEGDVVVKFNDELVKGGAMEATDKDFWTFLPKWATVGYAQVEGLEAFIPEFGHTAVVPAGGEGGCLRLNADNQTEDGSYQAIFYQEIGQLVEGDIVRVSGDFKYGENTVDNGLLWVVLTNSTDNLGQDGSACYELFNYWTVGTFLPAFDGNLAGAGMPEGSGNSGDGETPYIDYTIPATGTYYFGIDVRTVWGLGFGAGKDYFFDNLSVQFISSAVETPAE